MAFIVFKTTKTEKHMLKIRFLFSSELTAVMCAIGNARANSVWEGKIQNKTKPSPSSSRYKQTRVLITETLLLQSILQTQFVNSNYQSRSVVYTLGSKKYRPTRDGLNSNTELIKYSEVKLQVNLI